MGKKFFRTFNFNLVYSNLVLVYSKWVRNFIFLSYICMFISRNIILNSIFKGDIEQFLGFFSRFSRVFKTSHQWSNAIKLNTSFELKIIEDNYKINGIIKKFSLIKNLNLSRIDIKELQKVQDLNQESHQDSNIGSNNDLHIYIKIFLVLMSIAISLYIVKLILKCFRLKSKCNFDSTAGKK